jgi:hypothetical protein
VRIGGNDAFKSLQPGCATFYDSHAYRVDLPERVKTFEVDHPVTQADKLEKVRKYGLGFGKLGLQVVAKAGSRQARATGKPGKPCPRARKRISGVAAYSGNIIAQLLPLELDRPQVEIGLRELQQSRVERPVKHRGRSFTHIVGQEEGRLLGDVRLCLRVGVPYQQIADALKSLQVIGEVGVDLYFVQPIGGGTHAQDRVSGVGDAALLAVGLGEAEVRVAFQALKAQIKHLLHQCDGLLWGKLSHHNLLLLIGLAFLSVDHPTIGQQGENWRAAEFVGGLGAEESGLEDQLEQDGIGCQPAQLIQREGWRATGLGQVGFLGRPRSGALFSLGRSGRGGREICSRRLASSQEKRHYQQYERQGSELSIENWFCIHRSK